MAWHRSRQKRLKQSKKNRNRNISAKSKLKELTKELLALVNAKKVPEAKETLKKISGEYAKTAKRGIIKKENSSRHISRLTKKVNALAKA